jgi:hypothetical protein
MVMVMVFVMVMVKIPKIEKCENNDLREDEKLKAKVKMLCAKMK